MKGFLKTGIKKNERKVSKGQKVGRTEEKSSRNNCLKELNIKIIQQNYAWFQGKRGTPDTNSVTSFYYDNTNHESEPIWHTIPATPQQDFSNFPMTPRFISSMTLSSNFDYCSKKSSKNDVSNKTEDQYTRRCSLSEVFFRKLLMLHGSQTHLCIYRSRSQEEFKVFCIYASYFQENTYTGM